MNVSGGRWCLLTGFKVFRTSRRRRAGLLLHIPRYESGYSCLINLASSDAEDSFLSHFLPLLLFSDKSLHLTTLEVLTQTPELKSSLILLRPEISRQSASNMAVNIQGIIQRAPTWLQNHVIHAAYP